MLTIPGLSSRFRFREWSNQLVHRSGFTILIFCSLLLSSAFAQAQYVKTTCGFKVTTEVVYNSPQPGQTTFRWTVQNTNPGNGRNGTFQDLGHLDQRLDPCVNPANRISGGSYGKDKSQDCLSGDVLKFDYGTNGSTPTVYVEVFAGLNYASVLVDASFKGGSRGCCLGQIWGVGCCMVMPGAINGDRTVCSGDNPAVLGSATPASGSGQITYQWQSNTTGCSGAFTDIAGATAANYDPPAGLTQTTYYRRVAINSFPNGVTPCMANSNCVTVTVNNITAGSINNAQTVCSGSDPAALGSVAPATGSGNITYQWQSNTSGCDAAFTNIVGATSVTYDPPALTATTFYRRVATSTSNGVACDAASNCVSVAVNATITERLIYSATSAVVNSGGTYDASTSIDNAINQHGLFTFYTSGVTDFNNYIALNPEHTYNYFDLEWFSLDGSSSAVVTFDLGTIRTLDGLALWNEEVNGIGSLDLLYSADGTTFSPLLSGLTPTDNPVSNNYLADVFSFGAVNARYIRVQMNNCPGARCSLGEVAFRGVTSTCNVGNRMDLITNRAAADATYRWQTNITGPGSPPRISSVNSADKGVAKSNVLKEKLLVQAYPSPYSTNITFVLQSDVSGKGTLDVYNTVGQKLQTVFNGQVFSGSAQTIKFNVPTASRTDLIYKFQVNGKQITGKLLYKR